MKMEFLGYLALVRSTNIIISNVYLYVTQVELKMRQLSSTELVSKHGHNILKVGDIAIPTDTRRKSTV